MLQTIESRPFGAAGDDMIAHLNEHHEDAVVFLARVLGPCPTARTAKLTSVEPDGFDLLVTDEHGRRDLRLAFGHRAGTLPEARHAFLGLVAMARRRAGAGQETSIERELAARETIRTHLTRVTRVTQVTDRMREITVTGAFDGFAPIAPDQFVYTLAPPRGRRELTIDESFSWEAYERMPQAERPIGAYYTVRRWRPAVREMDLWVVLHADDGDGSWWARQASPGDAVALWGPRSTYRRPQDADSLLLVGDETAIPAIAAILESLEPTDRATVVIEVPDVHEVISFTTRARAEITWLWHDGAPSLELADVVRSMPLAPSVYAWGGGEHRVISAVRTVLRRERSLPAERVSMTAYWRRDAATS